MESLKTAEPVLLGCTFSSHVCGFGHLGFLRIFNWRRQDLNLGPSSFHLSDSPASKVFRSVRQSVRPGGHSGHNLFSALFSVV